MNAGSQRVRRIGLALLAVLSLALASCSSRAAKQLRQTVPGTRAPAFVTQVAIRGEYLDATLEGETFRLRFFFRPSELCAQLLRENTWVDYRSLGQWGRVQVEDEEFCEPVGIASLPEWRNRQPRSSGRGVKPRGTARFEIFYTDDEVVLARGRFPLATRVGWSRWDDTVAIFPNTDACREPLERGVAPIEFRHHGPRPLELVSAQGPCPVLGFAIPTPTPRENSS